MLHRQQDVVLAEAADELALHPAHHRVLGVVPVALGDRDDVRAGQVQPEPGGVFGEPPEVAAVAQQVREELPAAGLLALQSLEARPAVALAEGGHRDPQGEQRGGVERAALPGGGGRRQVRVDQRRQRDAVGGGLLATGPERVQFLTAQPAPRTGDLAQQLRPGRGHPRTSPDRTADVPCDASGYPAAGRSGRAARGAGHRHSGRPGPERGRSSSAGGRPGAGVPGARRATTSASAMQACSIFR